jgi:hypothetical protein
MRMHFSTGHTIIYLSLNAPVQAQLYKNFASGNVPVVSCTMKAHITLRLRWGDISLSDCDFEFPVSDGQFFA